MIPLSLYNTRDTKQYAKSRIDRMAIVKINFHKEKMEVVTKDARVSFSDMLGTIGGQFGLFLGLSFLGLYDMIAFFIRAMKEMFCQA